MVLSVVVGLVRARVSRIMLQSLSHGPMTSAGMSHIYKQHPGGYTCAVCGGLAATEEGVSHFWTNPVTTVHAEEADPVAPQRTSDAVPATPMADDAVHTAPDAWEPLTGLRQNLGRLGATGHDTSRTLRDMFDPVGRVGLNM